MARRPDRFENKRELVEGSLAGLGNARRYLELVSERVSLAARITTHRDLLMPALEDLQQIDRLILRVQEQIKQDNLEVINERASQ